MPIQMGIDVEADERPACAARPSGRLARAAFCASFVAGAAPALAGEPAPSPTGKLTLVYDVTDLAGCPTASEFEAAVVAKSGFDPFVPDGESSPRRLDVRFYRGAAGGHAELHVPLADRVETRTLSSGVGDCGELSESAALVVSLLLEPSPEPPPPAAASAAPSPVPAAPAPAPPPPASPAPPAAATHGPADGALAALAFGRVWAGAGLLPELGIGPSLGGGVAIGPWEVRLELTWAPPVSTGLFDATIDTQRWMVDAIPCRRFTPWERFSFTGCVSVHVGAIVYGEITDSGARGVEGAQAIAGIGVRPGAQLHLNEMFSIAFELEALAQLPALEVGGVSRGAYLTGGNFAGRMLLGVDARFE